MAIKSWWPAVALALLASAPISQLMVEHPKPHYRRQPSVSENKCGSASKPIPYYAQEKRNEKGEQKSPWIEQLFDKPTDFLLVVFNGLLMLFTGLLFYATVGLRKETKRLSDAADVQKADTADSLVIARAAAEAAKKSAKVAEDALTVLEKPYLFIDRKIKLQGGNIQNIKTTLHMQTINRRHFCVDYFIANYGRTPAIIKSIFANLVVANGIPEDRIIHGTPSIPPSIAVVQGEPNGPLMCFCKDEITFNILDDIIAEQKYLFFFGEVSYKDVFSHEYTTGFGWIYYPKLQTWNPAGGDDYNFHMTVSPEPTRKAPYRI
jgi:hypothetical protein